MMTNKTKKKLDAILKAVATMLIPIALVISSIVFFSQTSNIESVTEENEIMYNVIKYSLLALDFIAAIIILRTSYGLLYDLDILKSKQHKAKIRED